MVESVLQLKCNCNNYPWGKHGKQSLAAKYCEKTPGTDFKIDDSKDYAEMWMGTYPDLPSYVLSTGEDLQEVLNKNTELIGESTLKKFGKDLPFLPKVLSIAKALPLQCHPNKELSAKLHKQDPENFTDPNHKPEIAVALSDFEAFCGWKPIDEIAPLFELEPLQKYMPEKGAKFDDGVLKKVVYAMLTDEDDSIAKAQEELKKIPKERFGKQTYIPEMLPRLQEQYDKTDPGNLVALLTMNFLQLKSGDSIYIPADGIHAYLSGDIIECMARSNNVLNTGFCPRAERNSAKMFVETLTFAPHSKKDAILPSKPYKGSKNGKTVIYAPPMSEFNMLKTTLKSGESDEVEKVGGPSVFIVTDGEGTLMAGGKDHELKTGYIFFVGAGVETTFKASNGLEVYRAYCE